MADDEATDICEHCGRSVQRGTVHHEVGDGACVISTDAQVERSEGMSKVERRL